MKNIVIRNLITQLLILDKGMEVFSEPVSENVKQSLIQTIANFGDEALIEVHSTIDTMKGRTSIISLLDVLALIGNTDSVPVLIDIHRNYSGDSEGLAIVSALRNIASDESYLYMVDLVNQYSNGDFRVVSSRNEIYFACLALGEWEDARAVESLRNALDIEFLDLMPRAAIEALAKYKDGRVYLKIATDSMPDYTTLINSALENIDEVVK
ncbi:MAG: hypothetical protein AAFR81_23995 [Chloroflexota bacterium]